eukprot:scaffold14720_cov172-Ochromonas_danica.AAC.14
MKDTSQVRPSDSHVTERIAPAKIHDIYWLVSSGYICLCFCIAEMTSFLSFAGGSYGYVRCAMGPTMGYLIGFCESIEYILYVSASVV